MPAHATSPHSATKSCLHFGQRTFWPRNLPGALLVMTAVVAGDAELRLAVLDRASSTRPAAPGTRCPPLPAASIAPGRSSAMSAMRFAIRRIACSNRLRTARPLPKCLIASPVQLRQAEHQLRPRRRRQLVVVLFAQQRKNPRQLERRIVVEREHAIESRRQARIALQERRPSPPDSRPESRPAAPRSSSARFKQRLHRLVAIGILASCTTRLYASSMNSTPSSASLIFAFVLRPRLPHVLGHQPDCDRSRRDAPS